MLLEEENIDHFILFLCLCYPLKYMWYRTSIPGHQVIISKRRPHKKMIQPGQWKCCWKEIIMLKD